MVMAAQHNCCIYYHGTVYLKMAKMIHCMVCVFYHNRKILGKKGKIAGLKHTCTAQLTDIYDQIDFQKVCTYYQLERSSVL